MVMIGTERIGLNRVVVSPILENIVIKKP